MSITKKLSTLGTAAAVAFIPNQANAFSEDASYFDMQKRKYCMETVVNDMKGIVKKAFIQTKTENGKLSYAITGHFNFKASDGSQYIGSLKMSTHSKSMLIESYVKLNKVIHESSTPAKNEPSDTKDIPQKMADEQAVPGGLEIAPPPAAIDGVDDSIAGQFLEFFNKLKTLPDERSSQERDITVRAASAIESCITQDIRSASHEKDDKHSKVLANHTPRPLEHAPG